MDRNFGPSKITVVDRNFGPFFLFCLFLTRPNGQHISVNLDQHLIEVFKTTVDGCNLKSSKSTVVEPNFGPSKVTVLDINFGPFEITVVDRPFLWQVKKTGQKSHTIF